ncbi:hypothetical protein FSP39_022400 [Pinctada imbricata]|uniref:Kinesin motor domain-containing protein n=1 Tax=Pinctada imbricata TaxID=66713 RepID=A0AA88Y6A5_PINIB|nr:hypothetical protein FSP39_022400 [Pinctada imbricata]
MGTLFECLKEARLEKYYQTLRINGITRSEALARLDPDDYEAIGIDTPEDRRRLEELISIIKSVHASEPVPHSPAARSEVLQGRKSPRKRNRSPAVKVQEVSGRALSAVNDVRVRESIPQPRRRVSPVDLVELISTSESESSDSSSGHSDYEPASKHLNAASESPTPVRKTVVNRIKQKGYNYGVPNPSISSSVSRSRSRPISAGRPGMEEKIKVCVRKRPLNKREVKSGETDIATAESTTTLTIEEPKVAVDLTAYTMEHEFIFDEVFDETCSNEDVYIRAARPLINCLFDGGSATCFAYGQTGAGKTHTMIGSREVPGLYLLASHDIFSLIKSGQYGQGIKVWVSYFEIYCGQLFDLLNKRNRLHAREDGSHRVCIAGLTETEATDSSSLLQVLEYGNSVRSKGATGVNPDSSRSHAVLQMEIRDSADKRLGRISFIDLAGSERASDVTDTDRQTRMEGAEINQSLLALKECIRSIDQESKHTPFRQSKLTHILKDSFVGNSRTCMIANISPTQSTCEHTLNTLRYADRVKELRREAAPPGSKSSNAAAHMLMNIPPTAPSAFQPGNVLCSSTPIKPKVTRYTAGRSPVREVQLDPNETPIKGHGIKRKTVPKSAPSVTKPQIRKPSASIASRLSLIRHTASTGITSASQSTGNQGASRLGHEESSSDHTDSDSCNIPEPKPANIRAESNVPVVKSTDTENDFPTTDFNNEDEMNDLNRTSGKSATSSVSVGAQGFITGVKLSTSGHPLPVVDETSKSSPTTRNSHGKPVLRQKVYSDETKRKSPVPSSQEEGIPERRELLKHSPPGQKKESVSRSPLAARRQTPVSRLIAEHYEIMKKKTSNSTDSSQNIPTSKVIQASQQVTTSLSQHTPSVSNSQQTSVSSSRPFTTVSESFEDDMLFEETGMPFAPSHKIPRTPSTGDITSPLGLSRGSNGPLKLPHDPSVDLVLPAVMTAKSSDLTTFSQRSPRRFFKEPEPPPPPFSLALVNPTDSRPRVLRTPPPQPVNTVSSSHGGNNLTNDSVAFDSKYRLPPPYSQPDFERNTGEHYSDTKVYNDFSKPGPSQVHHVFSDSNISGYDKMPSTTTSKHSRKAGYEMNSQAENKEYQHSNTFSDKKRHQPREAFVRERSVDRCDSEHLRSASPASQDNALSTNEWYNTPANLDYHIVSSVQKSTTDLHFDVNSGDDDNVPEKDDHFSRNDRKMHVIDHQIPSMDRVDPNMPDFLPIQKRQVQDERPGSSRQDVATRLRSVFFKDPRSDSSHLTQISDSSEPNISDSGVGSQSNPYSSKSNSTNNLSSASAGNVHSDMERGILHRGEPRSYSPPSKDSNNQPSNNLPSSKSAITMEKLHGGSAFSPVHPQPVTSVKVSEGAVVKDHPMLKLRDPSPGGQSKSQGQRYIQRTTSSESDRQEADPRQRLISAHEEQLANVTSLCKQEMKLLLGAKAGHKTYEEYMEKVSNILSQKMAVIQLLQEEIEHYRTSHNNNI